MKADLFFKFYLSFFQFLFLGFGNFDGLVAAHDFVLHFAKLPEQLLLLFLCLFAFLFALADLSNEPLFFLLFEVCLIHNGIAVVFGLLFDLFSFLNKTFFVFSDKLFFLFFLLCRIQHHFAHNFVFVLKLGHHLWVCATGQRCDLIFKLLQLFGVLAQQGVLGVFVDARLVLNVLCAGRIAQGVHGFVEVVVCWADIGNHDCLGVAAERVL